MVDLPAPERSVNHSMHGFWPFWPFWSARALVHIDGLDVSILGAAQRKIEQPPADRVVRQPIDKDEPAGIPVLRVGLEGDRSVGAEIAHADLIQFELARGQFLQRIHVDLVSDVADGCAHGPGTDWLASTSPTTGAPNRPFPANPDIG